MMGHHLFNVDGLPPASGFSYGSIPAEGRTLHIAGMTGHHEDHSIDDSIVDQFAMASRSMALVIEEAGGQPGDLVSLTIYTSDIAGYRANLVSIGEAWRSVFGKWFPPMALIGVSELFDPAATVELVGVAVVS